uniref:Uncharacterized protein n=1 Tax=Oryza nivara TaxID=4536 RepID=A0A0E0J0A8_ORYNI
MRLIGSVATAIDPEPLDLLILAAAMWHQSQTFRVVGVAGLSSMSANDEYLDSAVALELHDQLEAAPTGGDGIKQEYHCMRPKKVVSMCLSTAKAVQDSCVSESLAVVAAVMKSFSYVTINNWQDIGMPKNGTKLRARTFGANTTLPAFDLTSGLKRGNGTRHP